MEDEQLICSGCGAPIQTENPSRPGYIPGAALARDVIICQRCFRLEHYGEMPAMTPDDEDYVEILHAIAQTDALVVKMVDIFDFDGSWLPGIARYAGNHDVLLTGNKMDLLPQSTNWQRLRQWLRSSAKAMGLRAKDVHLISAQTGEGVSELAETIDFERRGRDVYIVGSTNVGKSTFINYLIQEYAGDDRFQVTTSIFPGTTLNLIDFPLPDGCDIYDTPGVINHRQMAHILTQNELKQVTPDKEIKPKVYQLDEDQTLFFAGLARLDYLQGGRRSFVCYFSNELYIHRTKRQNADALYEAQCGELLQPPAKHRKESLPELVKHDFTIKEDKVDIVFDGLGWVTVHGGAGHVAAYAPQGIGVAIRSAII